MELLILLIVVALLGGLILGPIGFFKSMASGQRLASLDAEVDRLSVEVQSLRTLCFRLMREKQQASSTAATATASPVAEEPTAERTMATEQPVVEQPADEAEVADKPTTLEQLMALRRAQGPIDHIDDALDTDAPSADGPAQTPTPTPMADQAPQPSAPAAVEQPVASDDPAPKSEPTAIPAEPTRRLSIEEVLAGKVFVWIGAIALVLTGAFLLKLGFAEGIITPQLCVISAGILGLGMWGVGEWMLRRVNLISQALCGAAVAVLYGSIIAADHYMLLGTGFSLFGADLGIAFGLMAVVTIAAVVLSLRHGPAVAILGMLGGFMMPPLLVENTSPTLGMVLYLIAIEVGVLAVTGKRGWFGISLMTLIFSVLWSLGYTLIGDNPHERTLTAFLVLGTAGAYLFHTARIHRDPAATQGTRKRVLGLSIAATCSAIGVVALLAVKGGYTPRDLSMLGIVALGTLILARLDARQLAMPFVAMGLSLLVLFSDAARSLFDPPSETLITMAACFGGLFLLGGYLCMWGSRHRRVFAVMSAIAGPAFYGIVFFAGHETMGLREAWWPYTLGLAGIYALATLPMLLRRKAEHDWPIALFSVSSFVLITITLGQVFDHPRFAVSLALVSAIAVLIDLKLFIRPLRLAGCIAAFVAAALLVFPGPFDLTIHGGAVFNTLLPMYLLPAFCFGIIAWAAGRAGSSVTARNLTWLSIGTAGAMLLVLSRQIYQPANFIAETFALYEWTSYASVLMLAGFVTHAIGRRLDNEPILSATRCMVGIGAVLGLIGGIVPGNPLFHQDAIGGVELAAGLLALYAMPAALMWLWSRRPAIRDTPQLADMLRVMSITLIALFVGLQIRNGFAPDALHTSPITMFECTAYATAWILLGGFIQRLNQRRLQSAGTRKAGRVIFALGLLTTLVGSLAIYNPIIDQDAVGGWQLIPRLGVLYVLPAALMWLWSRGRTMADQPNLTTILRSTSILYLAVFVGQLVRNAFHAGDLHAFEIGLFECATYGLAWVLLGAALHFISPRCTLPDSTGSTGRGIFGVGLATLLIGNVLVLNPLWFRETVGSLPVLNGLWYLYGPVILILTLLARHARRQQQKAPAKLAGFTTIAIGFMLLCMLVRHGFSGDGYALIASNLASSERYAYSLAWVLFGGSLLIAGVFTRLDTLRYGSLAVLLLAIGKVFLIDTANLDNLYRVFSYFGLGVTLIGLGYLYQRLVFKRPTNPNGVQAA